MKITLGIWSLACMSVVSSLSVAAAIENDVSSVDSDGLQEIQVTATRQSEAAIRVPISLSVYTNEDLANRGFRDATDMMAMTPGIHYESSGFLGSNSISIRGISSSSGSSTVGIYVDETPIQINRIGFDPTSAFPKLFDLDRVEVLRGPQGTLFGASSEGGTIRFITPSPSLTQWSSYARTEYGSISSGGSNYEAGVAAGGPIVDGTLAVRASLYYRRDGGWIDRYDRLSDHLLDANSNSTDSYVARLALLWVPTENLEVSPSIMFQRTNLRDQGAYWELVSNPDKGVFRSIDPLASPSPDHFVLPALKVTYSWGDVQLVSNTSYFDRRNNPISDYSLLVPAIFAGTSIIPSIPNYTSFAYYDDTFQTFVEDARIQSNTGRFKWTAGLYFNSSTQKAAEHITDTDFADLIQYLYGGSLEDVTGIPLLDNRYTYVQDFRIKNREYAAYGEGSYEIVPGLRATVGIRASKVKLSNSNFVTGAFNFGTQEGSGESSEHSVTPKVNLSWQITDQNMVYATANKGFRPGGANVSLTGAACQPELRRLGFNEAPTNYDADTLWNYEVGTKNRILSGTAEVQASAFYISWKDIQQNIYLATCGLGFNANLGEAISKGFDFSVNQRFGPLVYQVQAGYTHAYYSKDLYLIPGNLPLVRNGSALQQKPWTLSASAQYEFSVVEHESFARIDWSATAGFYGLPTDDPTTSRYSLNGRNERAQNLFNARVGTHLGDVQLSVFANNLLNSHPVLGGYTNGGQEFFEDVTLTPRTIGITAEWRKQ